MKDKIFYLAVFLQLLLISGCGAAQDQNGDKNMNENQISQKTHYHIIGERAAIESVGRELSKPDEIWDHIHTGSRLLREKKYEFSITELKKALENSRIESSERWVARCALGEAYEAKGDYSLALAEINWQIEQHPRQDYLEELLTKKQKLEKLLAAKDQASQTHTPL